jgi:hypothetical protein
MEIAIDFNKDTFKSLSERLPSLDCTVVMSHQQFQTFKLMYREIRIEIDQDGFIKRTSIEPTPMGYCYGLEYKVEN